MPFFKSTTKTQKEIETIIDAALANLSHIDKMKKQELLAAIDERKAEYLGELSNNLNNPKDRDFILNQFEKFANTLKSCINNPSRSTYSINRYFLNYYPVGVSKTENYSKTTNILATAAIALGLLCVVAAILLLLVKPLISVAVLGVGLSLVLPSIIYFASGTTKNSSFIKDNEDKIFRNAAKLAKSDAALSRSHIEEEIPSQSPQP